MFNNKYHLSIVIAFLVAGYTNLNFAQNTVVLPSTDINADLEQNNLNNSNVNAKNIQNKQINNLSDLSKQDAEVHFNRSNNSINIRGLDSKRVLTTIDGIPTPWFTTGPRGNDGGIDAFDFNSIAQIDIMKGVQATKEGSGALSSSLQLRTLNAEDILGDKNLGIRIKADYAQTDASYGLNSAIASKVNDNTYLLQLGVRSGHENKTKGNVDSYNYLRSKANPSDNEQINALLKTNFNFGDHNIKLTAEHFRREKETDTRTSQGANDKGVTTYQIGKNQVTEYLTRQRLSLNYDWLNSSAIGFIDSVDNVIYWQKINKHNNMKKIYKNITVNRQQVLKFLTAKLCLITTKLLIIKSKLRLMKKC